MFKFFKRKKKASMTTGGDALLEKINGKELAYVTERLPDESGTVIEKVLGKIGRINASNGLITIMCDGKLVFSCESASAEYGELMSLAGVIVKGTDRENGNYRTVVAYYQYYRK